MLDQGTASLLVSGRGAAIVIIGLTGGIACGKSTVAEQLRHHGIPVVDADALARDVLAPGTPGLEAVRARFGPEVQAPDGALDRRALGRTVFASPEKRAQLEAIKHPAIALASATAFQQLAQAGHPIAVYEAALLVETGRHRQFPALVVVTAAPDLQRARLLARDPDLTPADADARIAAQMPLDEKRRVATYLIDNDGDRAALHRAVDTLAQTLRETHTHG